MRPRDGKIRRAMKFPPAFAKPEGLSNAAAGRRNSPSADVFSVHLPSPADCQTQPQGGGTRQATKFPLAFAKPHEIAKRNRRVANFAKRRRFLGTFAYPTGLSNAAGGKIRRAMKFPPAFVKPEGLPNAAARRQNSSNGEIPSCICQPYGIIKCSRRQNSPSDEVSRQPRWQPAAVCIVCKFASLSCRLSYQSGSLPVLSTSGAGARPAPFASHSSSIAWRRESLPAMRRTFSAMSR